MEQVQTNSELRDHRLNARSYLLLAMLALAVFLPGLFDLPPIDRDEARFVQASRQMMESGDYVDIRFQEESRYKKPVGIYWLQVAVAQVHGGGADAPIWVFRLVSLTGAVAAVLLTAWAAAGLFGARAGFLAALLLLGCLLLGVEARLAKTDAVLLACVVLAQGSLARLYLAARSGAGIGYGSALLFWLALGVALLVKGPIAPLICGLTLVTLGLWERRWRWMLALRPLIGGLLASVIVLPWLLAISLQSGSAFLEESLGGDLLAKLFQGQESHGAPPGYYLLTFWIAAWPFGFLALVGLLAAWQRRSDPAVRFCLAWLLPSWVVFELVMTKLPHYTLPLYPAIFLLLAGYLRGTIAAPEKTRWRPAVKVGWILQAVLSLLLIAAVIVVPPIAGGGFNGWSLMAAAAVAVAGILSCGPFTDQAKLRTRPERRVGILLAAGFLFYLGAYQGMLPRMSALWLSPQIARVVESLRPCPDSRLAAAGYTEPSLAVLVGTNTLLGSAEAAAAYLIDSPKCGIAVVESRAEASFMAALAKNGANVDALTSLSGINYSRGQQVTLTFYRIRQ